MVFEGRSIKEQSQVLSQNSVPNSPNLNVLLAGSSSSSLSEREGGRGRETKKKREEPLNNFDRLREAKERRKRIKEENEEIWTTLEKHRSLSCETLTILDVG